MAPFQDTAGSRIPKITECTLIEGQTCDVCKEHIDLDLELVKAKIVLLQAKRALKAVAEKRRLIRTEINRRHDKLTSRLPTEIVTKIFKATLRRTRMCDTDQHVIDSPLYLGAICQSWREIAWSTPTLWNWIHIFLRLPAYKNLADLVNEWLKRSGNLPLTIEISCNDDVVDACASYPGTPFRDEGPPFGDFVKIVNKYSGRWEYVSFQVPACFRVKLRGGRDGSPNLKMLRVCSTREDDCPYELFKPVRPSCIIFQGCPSDTWNKLTIAWDNVVDVYLGDFEAYHCLKAIQQMPRLKRCVFLDVVDKLGVHAMVTGKRFIHQNLEDFTFGTKGTGFERESLLDYFIFPNLTCLCLEYCEVLTEYGSARLYFWEHSVKSFLIQSSSKLQTLELYLPCQYKPLVEELYRIPSLRTLKIVDFVEPGRLDLYSFLVHLADTRHLGSNKDPASREFLPNLESCSFRGYMNMGDNKPIFEAMLDALRPLSEVGNASIRPLNHMEVELQRRVPQIYMSDENLRRFSDIVGAGIRLEIIDPYSQEDVMKDIMSGYQSGQTVG